MCFTRQLHALCASFKQCSFEMVNLSFSMAGSGSFHSPWTKDVKGMIAGWQVPGRLGTSCFQQRHPFQTWICLRSHFSLYHGKTPLTTLNQHLGFFSELRTRVNHDSTGSVEFGIPWCAKLVYIPGVKIPGFLNFLLGNSNVPSTK